jgi:uncharacterized protein YebE (UPF0316 family)
MDFESLFQTEFFTNVGLPILIFLARIIDVSLGTLRIIFLTRGMRVIAPIVGFFESLIWLIAIGQIVQNLASPLSYLAFAGGFAAGNFVGIYIEGKLAVGLRLVRIVTQEDAVDLVSILQSENFGVTSISAMGLSGRVRLIMSIVKRGDVGELIRIVKSTHPKAFITVEDVRSVSEGYIQEHKPTWLSYLRPQRK